MKAMQDQNHSSRRVSCGAGFCDFRLVRHKLIQLWAEAVLSTSLGIASRDKNTYLLLDRGIRLIVSF